VCGYERELGPNGIRLISLLVLTLAAVTSLNGIFLSWRYILAGRLRDSPTSDIIITSPIPRDMTCAQDFSIDAFQSSIASHKFCARFWQFDISKYGIYADL
jgi:hypothetical protein